MTEKSEDPHALDASYGKVRPGDGNVFEHAGHAAFHHQLHGGEGKTRFQWYFLDQSRLPVAVQRWDLEPGASEGMHAHGDDLPLEELYLVIDGEATMHVDGRPFHLRSGDAVLAPVNSEHDIVNTGDSTLRLVVVFGTPTQKPDDWSWSAMATASRSAVGPGADQFPPGTRRVE